MKQKRSNPYEVLRHRIKAWMHNLVNRPTKGMWFIATDKLGGNYGMADVYHKVKAAEDLGYEVILTAETTGLHCSYRKKAEVPEDWRLS